MSVTVANADTTPVAGKYSVAGNALEFRPAFTLDRGRSYLVRFQPSRLPVPRADTSVTATLALAAKPYSAPAHVARILPTTNTLPENQLRLYVEFSAPMSRTSGVDHIKLLDASGKEVTHAFLPLDADFWNPERTRYTLFLDPGRVKQGILPNEQLGRALHAGRSYTIAIDSTWRDQEGQPLAAPFRWSFRAVAADQAPISLKTWRVSPPARGGRDPLVVTFPEPLDHGLLERALGVESGASEALVGEVTIGAEDREWRFVPHEAWRPGAYRLVVLSILEDRAGNRVNRPFEVDMFERVDKTRAPERFTVPFVVR
jgi:hypothetical protein